MPIFVGMVVSSLCYVVAKLELTGPDIYQQLQSSYLDSMDSPPLTDV